MFWLFNPSVCGVRSAQRDCVHRESCEPTCAHAHTRAHTEETRGKGVSREPTATHIAAQTFRLQGPQNPSLRLCKNLSLSRGLRKRTLGGRRARELVGRMHKWPREEMSRCPSSSRQATRSRRGSCSSQEREEENVQSLKIFSLGAPGGLSR